MLSYYSLSRSWLIGTQLTDREPEVWPTHAASTRSRCPKLPQSDEEMAND